MIYLSKGIVRGNPAGRHLRIARCGQDFRLEGIRAEVWRNGRFGFAASQGVGQERALLELSEMGLAETAQEDTAVARYRILTQCVCCPAATYRAGSPASGMEKTVLCWLVRAGLRLSVAELVFLHEHRILPRVGLLYKEHRQALVEAIYMSDTIGDGLLESRMEDAACRDRIVEALLGLLGQKKILVL